MKIKFLPASKEVTMCVEHPVTAKKMIPDWYKKAPTFDVNKPEFVGTGKEVKNLGLKRCMPFLDAITAGYIQTTWCDMYVENNNGELIIRSASGPDLFIARETTSVSVGEGYYEIEFAWKTPWLPELPKGFSALICHPINRLDLPFYTLSGLVDFDVFSHTPGGNISFFIKKGFTGLIPLGTPMFQIIPIKRETWISETAPFTEKLQKKYNLSFKKFWGFYKDNFWVKKEYY
jgi:hypothetical protein